MSHVYTVRCWSPSLGLHGRDECLAAPNYAQALVCSIHTVKTLPVGGDTQLWSDINQGSWSWLLWHTTPLYPAKLHNQHRWSLSPFLLLFQLGAQQQQLLTASTKRVLLTVWYLHWQFRKWSKMITSKRAPMVGNSISGSFMLQSELYF